MIADATLKNVTQDDVVLKTIEKTDWTELTSSEVCYWLDRYFLRRQVLPVTSERVIHDFGTKSHAFQTTTNLLAALWQEVESQSVYQVIYSNWEKYLRIVYGSDVSDQQLFIRHTYLATLAKLMSWMRISESVSLPHSDEIIEILEGRFFRVYGIDNFLEEDFFSWLTHKEASKIGVNAVRWLFSLLQNYNLHDLSEDVLKTLYQELVDPETRHDLGEFYTPDWLAHRIVTKLLDEKPDGALLDPACGSGTFLYLAIREKREWMSDSPKTLQHVLESVYGADIHPLAVIIAKTNYVLALGDLLKKRKSTITIPVYLADTIHLPEWETQHKLSMEFSSYRVELDGEKIRLPEPLLQDLTLYDHAIELVKDFAEQNKGKDVESGLFHNFLEKRHFPKIDNEILVEALFDMATILKHFIEANRDTIWAYILKNAYKPLFFMQTFDFVVGNPPWIVLRTAEPAYQEFLKQQVMKEYRLLTKRAELITHLEVAALFLARAADLYLRPSGKIAFVITRSIFSSDQHDELRRGTFRLSNDPEQHLAFQEVWDCEAVTPLFNIPACVLIAEKGQNQTLYPIKGQILTGKLSQKNMSLQSAAKELHVEDTRISLCFTGTRSFWSTLDCKEKKAVSPYKTKFMQGATIIPRSSWIVEPSSQKYGFDEFRPMVETAGYAVKKAKKPYKDLFIKGNIESDFLYTTLYSEDLIPFGHFDYRLTVLPVEPQADQYKLVESEEARLRGYSDLAQWVERAEKEWTKRGSSKVGRMNALERLDYRHGLTKQNPQARWRVIYNTSGTYLTAAVIQSAEVKNILGENDTSTKGFVADHKVYFFDLNNRSEAFYLASILNAPIIDRLIKPMQSRGSWGPRDIHKKVFELPIPQFDATNAEHRKLSELGEGCTDKVQNWVLSGGKGKIKSIGKLRSIVREMLQEELNEINPIVVRILQ